MADILELIQPPVRSLDRPIFHTRALAYWELGKPRIATLVLAVTAVGFYLALPAPWASPTVFVSLLHTMLGTLLAVMGANALNQVLEVEYDRLMPRTANRPIPSSRLTSIEASIFGVALVALGTFYLMLSVGVVPGALAFAGGLSYVAMYTPLKREGAWCVYVGAVSGAMPMLIGWTAAGSSITLFAWILFAILFFWQLPHFASIAWMYREEYALAGYPMLPVVDATGVRTDLHVVTHTIALMIVSLLPVLYGFTGYLYAISAPVFGLAFLAYSIFFLAHKSRATARQHVIASVIYLPLLLLSMMVDRVVVG
ncbi:MAG: heme o synthase [Planctomycetota bacterium]